MFEDSRGVLLHDYADELRPQSEPPMGEVLADWVVVMAVAIPDAVLGERLNQADRGYGVGAAGFVAIGFQLIVVVARYVFGRDPAGEVAELLRHGVVDAGGESLFGHVEPVSQAQYLIARADVLIDVGDGLIHDVVLGLGVADVQVAQNESLRECLLF